MIPPHWGPNNETVKLMQYIEAQHKWQPEGATKQSEERGHYCGYRVGTLLLDTALPDVGRICKIEHRCLLRQQTLTVWRRVLFRHGNRLWNVTSFPCSPIQINEDARKGSTGTTDQGPTVCTHSHISQRHTQRTFNSFLSLVANSWIHNSIRWLTNTLINSHNLSPVLSIAAAYRLHNELNCRTEEPPKKTIWSNKKFSRFSRNCC
jgi:5-methylcytosine-specific restriction endonuclease McrA